MLSKKRLRHRWFPVNFARFRRTPFFTEHLRGLFLRLQYLPLFLYFIINVVCLSSITNYEADLPVMMILKPKVYSEPCQTSKVKRFAKMVNDFYPLTVFAKRSILRKIAVIHKIFIAKAI